MSLRLRLVLAVAALVALTLVLAGGLTGRAVLRPFAQRVFHGYLDQAVWVAEAVVHGEDAQALSDELGLTLTVLREEPDPQAYPDWVQRQHRGHLVAFHPRQRDRVAVLTGSGWVLVQRDLDLEAPPRQGLRFFFLVAAVVILGAWGVSGLALRPLRAARDAMARMGDGDLAHRLPETGPVELADAARAFNRLADRVDGMLRREKELMASISHELRTPLTRVRLEMELLRDEGASERRLDAMAGDIDELEALLSELVEISRMDLGQQPVLKEELELLQFAQGVLQRTPMGEHPAQVLGQESRVQADPRLLERALGNLLRNAARYTPPGTPVRVQVGPGQISVEDEGPGVPQDLLNRVFEPFFRVDASRSKDSGGLGLGLMIVSRVATLHGGSAQAENLPGGGFRVTLRIA